MSMSELAAVAVSVSALAHSGAASRCCDQLRVIVFPAFQCLPQWAVERPAKRRTVRRSCDMEAPGEFAAMMRERQLAIKAREAREQRLLQAAVAAAQRHGRRSGPPLPMEKDEFDIRPYELSAPQSLQELDTW